MKKKQLLLMINMLRTKVNKLEDDLDKLSFRCSCKCLTIEQAKKRDYLVRTNYKGKMKDAKLKKDFENEIEEMFREKISDIEILITNYEFIDKDTGKNVLDLFYNLLKEYEKKQIIIDVYGSK